MANYRVDADAVTELAFGLSAAADSEPRGGLSCGAACGSQSVADALSDAAEAFTAASARARDAVVDLAVGAVRAADLYRQADGDVTTEASES